MRAQQPVRSLTASCIIRVIRNKSFWAHLGGPSRAHALKISCGASEENRLGSATNNPFLAGNKCFFLAVWEARSQAQPERESLSASHSISVLTLNHSCNHQMIGKTFLASVIVVAHSRAGGHHSRNGRQLASAAERTNNQRNPVLFSARPIVVAHWATDRYSKTERIVHRRNRLRGIRAQHLDARVCGLADVVHLSDTSRYARL